MSAPCTIRPLDASTWDAFSATAELFERCGFSRGRQVGKHAWIVSKQVSAADPDG